jgi:hypothetical protein
MLPNMNHLNTLSIALLAGLLIAGPASANSPAATPAPGATATEPGSISTGSIDGEVRRSKEQRYEDCMAAWDKGTHMTKEQWSRTCRTSQQEFPEL